MPKLRLGPCQSQPYRQPRSRIESLEGLSVPLVCGHSSLPFDWMQMSHHGIAGSCNKLCFSISSLLGSRGPGSDATGRISSSMCSSSALGACAPWGCGSIKISASARCGAVGRCPQVHLRFLWKRQLALVPSRFLVLSSIPSRGAFELCPPTLLQLLPAIRHHLVS